MTVVSVFWLSVVNVFHVSYNLLLKPEKDKWGSGLEACQAALDLEKHVNQALLDLHKIADSNGDPQVSFILLKAFQGRLYVSW